MLLITCSWSGRPMSNNSFCWLRIFCSVFVDCLLRFRCLWTKSCCVVFFRRLILSVDVFFPFFICAMYIRQPLLHIHTGKMANNRTSFCLTFRILSPAETFLFFKCLPLFISLRILETTLFTVPIFKFAWIVHNTRRSFSTWIRVCQGWAYLLQQVHEMRLLHRQMSYHWLWSHGLTSHSQKQQYLLFENYFRQTEGWTDRPGDGQTDGNDIV